MKARLIFTKKCNRSCEGCCNESLDWSKIKTVSSYEELKDYEEVILTGGEPMLDELMLFGFLYSMNEMKVPVILQTAFFPMNEVHGTNILHRLKGITYTIHENPSEDDMERVKRLRDCLVRLRTERGYTVSARLNIDKRAWNKIIITQRSKNEFSEIRKMEWKDDCPIPDGVELLVWEG